MISKYLLPHVVTLIRPVVTIDAYNNEVRDYGAGAAHIPDVSVWLQQDSRQMIVLDGGTPLQDKWLLVTDREDVQRRDRFTWTGPSGTVVFELDGQPEPVYTPLEFHHTEAALKVVNG